MKIPSVVKFKRHAACFPQIQQQLGASVLAYDVIEVRKKPLSSERVRFRA
jgi:hypothetical protein